MLASPVSPPSTFDAEAVRASVPALHQSVNGRPLVYLDNGATTQKPRPVIDRIVRYYERENANVHRGVHRLSQDATDAMEAARERVGAFVGADAREVVFTRGTTEAVNLVASTWGRENVRSGDELVVTMDAHHANFVPWQMLAEAVGARLRVVPVREDGSLDRDAYAAALSGKTRLVALGHVSNALGTVHPVADLVAMAHDAGALALVDGAQALAHVPVDVRAIGADFYVASAHKAYGPMGIGALFARADLLEAMPPYQFGGDMIDEVTVERTTFAAPPSKFEAGTPHVEGIVGMAAALDWLDGLGRDAVFAHEHDVLAYATARLDALGGIRLVGTAPGKVSVLSFLVDGAHPYDVGALLDQQGVAVRTGNHCAQPLMTHLGVPGTVRATFAVYNTRADADALVAAVAKAQAMLVG
ncbi:MAG: cysteine desulfurase [Bacteroidetes bacterium]|nr:cysteine desulfurase [Bacteroidota bacterium]